MYPKNIRIKAVAAGLLTDIVGSTAVGFVIAIYIVVIASKSGDASPEHLAALRNNFYLKLIGLVGTTFFTGLGGYVAARMSKPNGIFNSIILGVICTLLGIALAVSMPGITPIWKLLTGLILTIPAAWAGGKIAACPNHGADTDAA
jgi:hypothetical protein